MSRRWDEETQRLFVACDLPGVVGYGVGVWQQEALAPNEAVRVSAALHITLCFLGSTARDLIPRVTEALETVDFAPFELAIAEPLFLPEHGRKNVVALAIDDQSGGLAALQEAASAALARAGVYKPSRRPFLAHLTVGRFRRPGHPFPLQNVTIPAFGVDRMVLYSSLLERAGAVHTPVAVFPAS